MTSKIHSYDREDETVTWDKHRCLHVAACVQAQPRAFNPKAKPWVQPDNVSADAVLEAVLGCPTGALHLVRSDGSTPEPTPGSNTATIVIDGPIHVRGDVTIETLEGERILSDTRLALCRCGLSSNKPLCDNSHVDAFTDLGSLSEAVCAVVTEALDAGALTIRPRPDGPVLFEGPLTVVAADGTSITRTKGALCRCGASANKPFCDGAHKGIAFSAP